MNGSALSQIWFHKPEYDRARVYTKVPNYTDKKKLKKKEEILGQFDIVEI